MRRFDIVWLLFVVAGFAAHCPAQVAPSAHSRGLVIRAGGEGSIFQPDYADNYVGGQTSPNRLYGFGAYVDADFSRWVQIEAEGRWLHWHEYLGIDENTYAIGPRVPIYHFGRFTPYGKFLIGSGSMSDITGKVTDLTFGGGVDYQLDKKFTLRAFDFEYQDWRIGSPHIQPYGGSVGLSYRFF